MPKILLAEDNEDNRSSLAKHLRQNGFDVVMAVDGQEAVDLAKTEKPDLILMDMNMPVVDGWQATKTIKDDPACSSVPILGLSAQQAEEDRAKALQAGCANYHTKPVDLTLLLTQIESLIKQAGTPLSRSEPIAVVIPASTA